MGKSDVVRNKQLAYQTRQVENEDWLSFFCEVRRGWECVRRVILVGQTG
jgi:hypothetical protein